MCDKEDHHHAKYSLLAALTGAIFATAVALPNRADAMTFSMPAGVLSAGGDRRCRTTRAGALVQLARLLGTSARLRLLWLLPPLLGLGLSAVVVVAD